MQSMWNGLQMAISLNAWQMMLMVTGNKKYNKVCLKTETNRKTKGNYDGQRDG